MSDIAISTLKLLQVHNLSVRFDTPEGTVEAVTDVSFSLDEHERLAVVGESGSGKSQLFFSLMGLMDPNATLTGSAMLEGRELVGLSQYEMNRIRSETMSMVFQDPMSSLNPYVSIGDQLMEVLQIHKGFSFDSAFAESVRLLEAVYIPNARQRMKMYPHEFSGGMRQRVVIAMALLCKPKILIADEPTTALDVTIQAQLIQLLLELQQEFGMSIILITHDLGIVASLAQRVLVMYGGRVMELGRMAEIFSRPRHPYTQGLIGAIPRLDDDQAVIEAIPGDPPTLMRLPPGCPFQERCRYAQARCRALTFASPEPHAHYTACPYHDYA